MKQIVIMPGGFHPFHAGHYALYQSAIQKFPNADVYVAATDDQSERPFPFNIKEKLAKLAGVQPGRFVQVKSPFQAKEITQHYNPEQDVLIFVRSEKDRNESPKPGGTKKDGTPSYFQPWTGKDVQPFSKHAYFEYLPTVEFGPGITSATQIRQAWPKLNDKRKLAMVYSLYPDTQKKPELAQSVVKIFDKVMGQQGVAEGGAETSWSDDTDKITLQDILELTKHIKQIDLPISNTLKSKLIHWDGNPEEIERINQVTVSNQFPILVMVDEQGQINWILDGNHRLHKAILSNAKSIPAKLIKPSDLNDKAKKIFHIKEQGVAESKSAKSGIVQTDVYGTSAYHAKCLEPNCDWESKRYDRIKQAQAAAQKHAEKHFDKKQEVSEAHPKQQLSVYNPDGETYRGEKMPSIDTDDIFSKREPVSLDTLRNEPTDEPNMDQSIKDLIQSRLDVLSPKEQKVLKLRFWHDMTLADIGEKIGVHPQRIRQIEASAMRKMIQPSLDLNPKELMKMYVPESADYIEEK